MIGRLASIGERDRDLIMASMLLWFVSLPIHATIAGRMQVANLGDALSLLLLLPVLMNMRFGRASLVFMTACLLFLAVSACLVAVVPFGMFLAVFYVVSILHVLVYYEAFRRDAAFLHRIIRVLALMSRLMTLGMLLHFALTRHVPYAFLMQDKTYFLVYLNTLIVVELLNAHVVAGRFTTAGILAVTALILLQLTTASRSVLLFAPFFALATLGNFFQRKAAITGRILFVVALAASGAYIALHAEEIKQIAVVLRRLTTLMEAGDSSVGQHGILIQVALHEKFQDWPTFLFGTGPAGFQVVAERSELFPELMSILPDFGLAVFSPQFAYFPGTSIWVETFLEWPIFLWIPFVGFMAYMLLRVLVRQRLVYAVFMMSVYATGLVYSLHHSSFFFLTLILMVVLAFCPVETRRGEAAAGARLDGHHPQGATAQPETLSYPGP